MGRDKNLGTPVTGRNLGGLKPGIGTSTGATGGDIRCKTGLEEGFLYDTRLSKCLHYSAPETFCQCLGDPVG